MNRFKNRIIFIGLIVLGIAALVGTIYLQTNKHTQPLQPIQNISEYCQLPPAPGYVNYTLSKYNVNYDLNILDRLKTSKWVAIIVEVKDTSNISVSYKDSKEMQAIKDKERNAILINKTDSVLSTISDEDFKLQGKFPMDGFYGCISKNGLDELINNFDVGTINLDFYTTIDDFKIV